MGFYIPCSHHQVSNHLTLLAESLPSETNEESFIQPISRGNRNRCLVPGILYSTNTLEGFQALDKQSRLKEETKKDLISKLNVGESYLKLAKHRGGRGRQLDGLRSLFPPFICCDSAANQVIKDSQ